MLMTMSYEEGLNLKLWTSPILKESLPLFELDISFTRVLARSIESGLKSKPSTSAPQFAKTRSTHRYHNRSLVPSCCLLIEGEI